jgi:glycosyltransferase involved in cell wall biosynthesis
MHLSVSVVVPAHNAEPYLEATLASILAQSYRDFDLVVVDDGSSDRTAEIARRALTHDPRGRVIHQANLGEAGARDAGIEATRGALVAMTDADDLWHAEKLARQIQVLEAQPALGAVFTYIAAIDSAGEPSINSPVEAWFNVPHRGRIERLKTFFQGRNTLCGPTVLLRRAALDEVGPYDAAWGYGTDFDLWFRLLARYDIAVIEEPLYRYRVHASSLTNQVRGATQDISIAAVLLRNLALVRAEDLDPGLAALPPGPERDERLGRAHLVLSQRLEQSGIRELLPAVLLERVETRRYAPHLLPRRSLFEFGSRVGAAAHGPATLPERALARLRALLG